VRRRRIAAIAAGVLALAALAAFYGISVVRGPEPGACRGGHDAPGGRTLGELRRAVTAATPTTGSQTAESASARPSPTPGGKDRPPKPTLGLSVDLDAPLGRLVP